MNFSMNRAIQNRLDALVQVPQVRAALLVMSPAADSEKYRYQAKGVDPEIWQFISALSHRFKANGRAELINQLFSHGGEALQLLCASIGSGPSFIIAATLPRPDAFDLSATRNALVKVAHACLIEADSMKWR
jgi:hypothetical protein